MDIVYRRGDRSPTLVRKVMTPEGKRPGGIYDKDRKPVKDIVSGNLYRAKIGGKFRLVVAGPNQVMSQLEEYDTIEDPRVRSTEADARHVGFDLTRGEYLYDPK